jgi:3-phosphoshikimate 1-carboxyvinyltransferase
MGARIEIRNKRSLGLEPIADIEVSTSGLNAINVKGSMIPNIIDDIPALCIAASFSKGKTVIEDAGELRVKESDRIEAIFSQLSKLGVEIKQNKDGLEIIGKRDFMPKDVKLESFGDHRIALSLSIMAIASENGLNINDFGCSDISFPGYYEIIKGL